MTMSMKLTVLKREKTFFYIDTTPRTTSSMANDYVAVNIDVSLDDGNAAPDSAATAVPAAADSDVNMNNIAPLVVVDVFEKEVQWS